MEYCIEARALKSSLFSQITSKQQTSSYDQELWLNNVVVNHVSSDEFSIDDLLDLSDKDEFKDEEDFASVSSSQDNDSCSNSMNSSDFSTSSSSGGDLVSLTGDDLPLPIDDMESLEWLSTIVDDSMSEHNTLLFPPAKLKEKEFTMNRFEPVVSVASHGFTVLGLTYPVPKKFRTKRSRKAGRVWSTGSRSFTESSSNSSSSHDSSITSPMLMMNPVYFTHLFEKQPKIKKQRKNPVQYNEPEPGSGESLSQRRCTHCQVQKTPQWRTGPLGPKTLCNACGVRYKSGRLFPEYRPACSPTFSVEVHSNSHRKVLEMRKKKDVEVGVEPGFVNIAVQSASS